VTLADMDEGSDPATECWNRLLGSDAFVWRSGKTLTIGQLVALARGDSSTFAQRQALKGMGIRLLQATKTTPWSEADLAIANKHPGLDRIFKDTEWAGGRSADALQDLEIRLPDGQCFKTARTGPVRFDGPQSRSVLVPAAVLPSTKDEYA
jgi:hypothetical protein